MSRFGKLLNFELNRFMRIYLVLISITIVSQFIGVFAASKSYLNLAHDVIQKQGTPVADFLEMFGMFSMNKVTQTMLFAGPIILAAVALIFYMFLIWYRDWFSKNTFVYRLLMLPTSRLNVFLAKATAIMVMVFGLVAVQLILLPLEGALSRSLVPIEFRTDLSVMETVKGFEMLAVLIPQTFTDFILNYGIGFMVMIVLFTVILFERSFRIKGIIMGVIYGVSTVVIFISPVLLQNFFDGRLLHPIEVFILLVITGMLVITGSILMSRFLLKNKVTV